MQLYILRQTSIWLIFIFTIPDHVIPVAQSISTVAFVDRRSLFDHTGRYRHILLYNTFVFTENFHLYLKE